MIIDSLEKLQGQKKLNKPIVLWGIGNQTRDVIIWLRQNGYYDKILFIADNFKCTFCQEYEGIPVKMPKSLQELKRDSFIVILSINYADDVWKR